MAVAADVPGTFDVVINGQGYRLLDALERHVSTYGSRALATYTRSQTFVERQNVSGNYGDNQQDFFLTGSQHDFSLGEGQRYYVADDSTSSRRFLKTTIGGVSVDKPGEATLQHTSTSLASNTIIGSTVANDGLSAWFATASNVKRVNSQGTITDYGAHGLTGTLTDASFSLVDDGTYPYVSGVGATNVRKYTGTAWAEFSKTPAAALCYADNGLFGIQEIMTGTTTKTVTFLGRYTGAGQPPYFKTYTSGNFVLGETVTQTTSAATGTVAAWNASTHTLTITPVTGTFVSGGTNAFNDATFAITGSSSGAVGYAPSVTSTAGTALQLNVYDTTGKASGKAYWKDASGNARNLNVLRMLPTGGSIKMLFRSGTGSELWEYDGDAATLVAALPAKFSAFDMAEYGGVLYISGQIVKATGATSVARKPAVYYYANGSWGLTWQAEDFLPGNYDLNTLKGPGICALDEGIAFADAYSNTVKYYNGSTGAVSTLAATSTGEDTLLAGGGSFFLLSDNTGTAAYTNYVWPSTSYVSSGIVNTSMFDFGSSLNKYFRSVKIEAIIPAGASIDVAYRLDDPTISTTALATGITSGTEVTIGQSGHSIGFAITLNKGSSSTGPTLKRVSLRSAPALLAFRSAEYHLDLSGRDGEQMIPLRNGSQHSKDGLAMATDIRTASAAGVISITDRFGTYNGVIESHEFDEFRPEEFVGVVQVREV